MSFAYHPQSNFPHILDLAQNGKMSKKFTSLTRDSNAFQLANCMSSAYI